PESLELATEGHPRLGSASPEGVNQPMRRSRVRLKNAWANPGGVTARFAPLPAAQPVADEAAQHRIDGGLLRRGELAPEAGALRPRIAVVARLEGHPPGADPPPERPHRVLQAPPPRSAG